jgi:hypothetical protein
VPGRFRVVWCGIGWGRAIPRFGRRVVRDPGAPESRPRIGAPRWQPLGAPRPGRVAPGSLARSWCRPRLNPRPSAAAHLRGRSGCSVRWWCQREGGGSPHRPLGLGRPAGLRRRPDSGQFGGPKSHQSRGPKSHRSHGRKSHQSRGPKSHRSHGRKSHWSRGPKNHQSRGPKSHRSRGPWCWTTGPPSCLRLRPVAGSRSGAVHRRLVSVGRAVPHPRPRRRGLRRRDRCGVLGRSGRLPGGPGHSSRTRSSRPGADAFPGFSRPGRSRRQNASSSGHRRPRGRRSYDHRRLPLGPWAFRVPQPR